MEDARLVPWILETVRRAGLPAASLFALHVIASRGFDAYVRLPGLDVPVHLLGGAFIAYFFDAACRSACARGILGPFHPRTHALLLLSLTAAATLVWEFGEWISDRWFGTRAQLGLDDTLGDMLCGLLGGVAFAVAAFLRRRASGR